PQIAAEAPGIVEEVESGIDQLEELLDEGLPFIEEGTDVAELLALAQEQAVEFLQREGVAIASTLAEGVTGLLFGLVGLFFYLKDGRRIAAWSQRLFPRAARDTVGEIGVATWTTLGGYFRGQLLIALADAIFIGIGLALLGVPLVVPLAVLVFFGGLFPIIGAVLSGAVAVLVALASQGLVVALGALAVVLAVQQVESNVLAPIVLGKATELHPLAVIVSLTAGGVLLGILGAFLAVPVAASLARGARILRQRFDAADGLAPPQPTVGPSAPAG
ncbi:MAG: AI-2E family transporter, partial [Egibacteraceae bacterium]